MQKMKRLIKTTVRIGSDKRSLLMYLIIMVLLSACQSIKGTDSDAAQIHESKNQSESISEENIPFDNEDIPGENSQVVESLVNQGIAGENSSPFTDIIGNKNNSYVFYETPAQELVALAVTKRNPGDYLSTDYTITAHLLNNGTWETKEFDVHIPNPQKKIPHDPFLIANNLIVNFYLDIDEPGNQYVGYETFLVKFDLNGVQDKEELINSGIIHKHAPGIENGFVSAINTTHGPGYAVLQRVVEKDNTSGLYSTIKSSIKFVSVDVSDEQFAYEVNDDLIPNNVLHVDMDSKGIYYYDTHSIYKIDGNTGEHTYDSNGERVHYDLERNYTTVKIIDQHDNVIYGFGYLDGVSGLYLLLLNKDNLTEETPPVLIPKEFPQESSKDIFKTVFQGGFHLWTWTTYKDQPMLQQKEYLYTN